MEYSNIKNQDLNDDQLTNLPSTISTCPHHLMVPIIDHEPEISSSSSSSSASCATALNAALRNVAVANVCMRVPRPTNAFMIYANENRKCLAKQFPLDSNKEISKRLGHCWKDLEPERKAVYYTMAKQVDADHKKKYPNYVYNPKEARIRKALRDATREKMLGVGTGLAPNSAQQRPSGGGQRRLAQPWMLPDQDDHIMMSPSEPSGPGGGALRAGMASPMCGTGFPMSIAPMGSYASPMHHPHAAYINNPLAQLQQQTDLWNPYHHKSQTKSPQDAPYLMSPHHHHHHHMSVSSPYTSHVPPNLPPPMTFSPSHPDDNKAVDDLIDNTTTTAPLNSAPTDHMVTTQSSNSTVPTITAKMEQPETPPEQQHEETALLGGRVDTMRSGEDVVNGHGKVEMVEFDSCNGGGESSTDLIKIVSTSPGFEQQQEKIVLQNPFDIPPSAVANNNVSAYHIHQQQQRKKSINQKYQQHMMHQQQQTTFPSSSSSSSSCATQHRNTTCYHHHPHQVAKEPPVKPLPDFNEAFGGTERGRYQSPPNNTRMLPILSQSKSDCVDFLGFFGYEINDALQCHFIRQQLIMPLPLIPPNPVSGGGGGDSTTTITYRIAEVEIRKQFILKYAENYNYDHMELMLHQNQQQSNVAQGRAVSYHYVTLPAINCTSDVLNVPISQSASNIGLTKEMYLVNGGPGHVNQALNLTTDLK